ncbi:MAG: helix-turn-helix domain-containing protein [Clostridia bacterium]|nr:helix-turn-helix domain-containing protein [Clostridia bacterium]
MIKIGEKIKSLRKQKDISQEVFANYLGVSFQAVSKWENGNTLPDITLIPAIASFFGVSTDELFDFNVYKTEKNIRAIVDEHSKYWYNDTERAEQIIRDGLKKYPGNETLLNCLIGVLAELHKNEEVISIGKVLMETTKNDEIRIDTYRIMAMAYKEMGEYQLAKESIERIPELYFTKLEVKADLLENEEKYAAAKQHTTLCTVSLVDTLWNMGEYLKEKGEFDCSVAHFRTALRIVDAVLDDSTDRNDFTITQNLINAMSQRQEIIKELLSE